MIISHASITRDLIPLFILLRPLGPSSRSEIEDLVMQATDNPNQLYLLADSMHAYSHGIVYR